MGSSEPAADVLVEGPRLVREASQEGLELRLIGGVAVRLRTQDAVPPALTRDPPDIDLVTGRGGAARTTRFLRERGYEPAVSFNALHGQERMLFFDEAAGRQIDVLVGAFRMSHEIPLRLDVDALTVPLAELLLTKLQVVELNEKDIRDALALLCAHPVAEEDDDGIGGARVAGLLAADWGLWRTATANLERLASDVDGYDLPGELRESVRRRVDALRARIDEEPKTRGWRLRARIGERKRWYDLPEEPG